MLHEPHIDSSAPPRLTVVRLTDAAPIETTGGTIAAAVVETLSQLVALKGEWEALFERSPAAAPPLRWEWVREWWRYFGSTNRTLTIIVVRRGRELIGVLPLYRERSPRHGTTLFAIGLSRDPRDSFYPEYLDVLTAPGAEALCGSAIVALWREAPWGARAAVHFGLTRTGGALQRLIAPVLRPPLGFLESFPRRAPIADLSDGFDRYLERLSANARQQMRRLVRAFRDTPGAVFSLADTPAEADLFLRELIDLHQARWTGAGQPGAFSTPERVAFHRAVVARLGSTVVLSRLAVHGRTVTVLYGFLTGTKFDFYQSGNAPVEHGLKRAGILAHLLTMEALAARGVTTYDFLEGEAPYKMQLRTGTLPLTECAVLPFSPHAALRALSRSISAVLHRRSQ